MGLFDRVKRNQVKVPGAENKEQRTAWHVSQTPPAQVMKSWGLGETAAGIAIDESSALSIGVVYACVRIIAENVASLPLILYRRVAGGGKERATDHALYTLLHDAPNPEMTALEMRETLTAHICTWGNGYAEIESDSSGQVRALWPLRPDRMRVERVNGALVYRYRLSKPSSEGAYEALLRADQVLHIRGLGYNGIVGYSPIALTRQALGLAAATEEFGSRFFGNGARPGGVLEHPGQLSDKAYTRLRDSFEERHKGLENASRIAILEEGIKYHEIGIPPEDAQFLQTRKFQKEEVAMIFRVPPHMLADLERATFSNIEQQSLDFVIYTLRPWLVRWEQAISLRLLLPRERPTLFSEHLVDALLRGDIQARYAAYAIGRQWGWLSADDVREFENMNPLPNGEGQQYLVPLNMAAAGAEPAPQAAPPAATRALPRAERRSTQSIAARRKLIEAERPVLREQIAVIVRREAQELRALVKKAFKQRGLADWEQLQTDFWTDHEAFITRKIGTLMQSYATLVADAAGAEVDHDPDNEKVRAFTDAYVEAYARRHIGYSQERLKAALDKAAAHEIPPEEALDAEIGAWEDGRPDDEAREESVRVNGAVSVLIYSLAGLLALYWRASGESTCPYCRSLDGRQVGINDYFLLAGEHFQPDGAESPLKPGSNIKNPPVHSGCDCMVSAF